MSWNRPLGKTRSRRCAAGYPSQYQSFSTYGASGRPGPYCAYICPSNHKGRRLVVPPPPGSRVTTNCLCGINHLRFLPYPIVVHCGQEGIRLGPDPNLALFRISGSPGQPPPARLAPRPLAWCRMPCWRPGARAVPCRPSKPSGRRILPKRPSRCVSQFRAAAATNRKRMAYNVVNDNSTYPDKMRLPRGVLDRSGAP